MSCVVRKKKISQQGIDHLQCFVVLCLTLELLWDGHCQYRSLAWTKQLSCFKRVLQLNEFKNNNFSLLELWIVSLWAQKAIKRSIYHDGVMIDSLSKEGLSIEPSWNLVVQLPTN